MRVNPAHIFSFAVLSFLAESVSALPSKVLSHYPSRARCVYFQTNNDLNSVVAIRIDHTTGKLVAGSERETPTWGKGAVALNATGQAQAADTLFSQGAVTRDAAGDVSEKSIIS